MFMELGYIPAIKNKGDYKKSNRMARAVIRCFIVL